MEKEYITNSEKETENIGASLAKLLNEDSFVALFGELGVGKTVFTRGLVGSLIPEAVKLVHSPTFALVNEYIGKDRRIYHCDMYRITNSEELYGMGFDDYFGNGIIVTEWSENIVDMLPRDAYRVVIERLTDTKRKINVTYAK